MDARNAKSLVAALVNKRLVSFVSVDRTMSAASRPDSIASTTLLCVIK